MSVMGPRQQTPTFYAWGHKTGGNKRQTALRLGISRPTLDRMIEKHGLQGEVVKSLDHDGNGG